MEKLNNRHSRESIALAGSAPRLPASAQGLLGSVRGQSSLWGPRKTPCPQHFHHPQHTTVEQTLGKIAPIAPIPATLSLSLSCRLWVPCKAHATNLAVDVYSNVHGSQCITHRGMFYQHHLMFSCVFCKNSLLLVDIVMTCIRINRLLQCEHAPLHS